MLSRSDPTPHIHAQKSSIQRLYYNKHTRARTSENLCHELVPLLSRPDPTPRIHSQKVLYIAALYSKHTRTLTFENLCQELENLCGGCPSQPPRLAHRYCPKRGEVRRQKKRARLQKKNTAVVPPKPHASHTDIVPEGGDHTIDAPVGEQS